MRVISIKSKNYHDDHNKTMQLTVDQSFITLFLSVSEFVLSSLKKVQSIELNFEIFQKHAILTKNYLAC